MCSKGEYLYKPTVYQYTIYIYPACPKVNEDQEKAVE